MIFFFLVVNTSCICSGLVFDTTYHQSVHEKMKYNCDLCGFKLATTTSLTKHKESVHEGITYECNQCSSHFTNKGSKDRLINLFPDN